MRYYEEEERTNYTLIIVGIVFFSIAGFLIYNSYSEYQADVEAQHVQGVMMQATDALPNGVDGLLGRSFLARFYVTFEKNKWSIATRR